MRCQIPRLGSKSLPLTKAAQLTVEHSLIYLRSALAEEDREPLPPRETADIYIDGIDGARMSWLLTDFFRFL